MPRSSSSLKPSMEQRAGFTKSGCPSKFSTAIPIGLALKASRKSWVLSDWVGGASSIYNVSHTVYSFANICERSFTQVYESEMPRSRISSKFGHGFDELQVCKLSLARSGEN